MARTCTVCNRKASFWNSIACDLCGSRIHEACFRESEGREVPLSRLVTLFPGKKAEFLALSRLEGEYEALAAESRQEKRKIKNRSAHEALEAVSGHVCVNCMADVRERAKNLAERLVYDEDFDAATKLFDDLGMVEEARSVRRKSRLTPSVVERERIIERQIVRVKCRYCGTLNDDTAKKCTSCGANI